MSKYVLQLGRDTQLSILEIRYLLKSSNVQVQCIEQFEDILTVSVEENLNKQVSLIQERLGGTLKIAEVFFEGELDTNWLDKFDFYFPKNFNFFIASIGLTQKEENHILGEVKLFAKKNKLKGVVKSVGQEYSKSRNFLLNNPDLNFELVITKNEQSFSFAKTLAIANPHEFMFKDNQRPARRFTHGTSFRLAKMMINILALDKGQVLVDPFCGIGTFLIEGMLAGLDVIGIDVDQSLVSTAMQNVNWARKTFGLKNKCEIICADSKDHKFQADGVVFEPYMGPFLGHVPKEPEARKILATVHKIYTDVFKNLSECIAPKGRVVCILPEYTTQNKKTLNLPQDLFAQTGFRVVSIQEDFAELDFDIPIDYYTPDGNKIGRKLWILEKISK